MTKQMNRVAENRIRRSCADTTNYPTCEDCGAKSENKYGFRSYPFTEGPMRCYKCANSFVCGIIAEVSSSVENK